MRFLLDENTEFRLAGSLLAEGHDVTAIAHDYPFALADRDVLTIARQEQRILVTNDRDFGELIVREGLPHAGVIYLRLPAPTVEIKFQRLREVLTAYHEHLHEFLIVSEDDVRMRAT